MDCSREGEKPSHKLWWMECCSCVQVTKACRSTGVTDGVSFPGQFGATRPLVKQHLGRLFLHLGVKPECSAQPAVTALTERSRAGAETEEEHLASSFSSLLGQDPVAGRW